ncbi:MAG: LegC family aminotransferase [Oscillospiraceae bacterium]|nr:LegC family aminotransferase [Oscillospiraceae bacterium]
MFDFIPLSVPNLKGRELEYVTQAVETEWVSSSGPYILDFEQAIAQYIGVDDAVAVQSGTAALHMVYLEAGITDEDMVIMPDLTFIGTLNPIGYIGAEPILFDCDEFLCIDPEKIERFCALECDIRDQQLFHKGKNKRVKAIVAAHIFGALCDMEKIMDIAERYHLTVIEDASESLGCRFSTGRYAERHAGTIGDFAVISFNGNKIITTGGGGIILARNKQQLEHIRYLSRQSKDDELRFIHNEIGYNYRMTNLQAALGLAQLEQLDSFVEIKKRNYEIYESFGLKLLSYGARTISNYWFYSLLTDNRRDLLIEQLAEKSIQTRPVWELMHRLPPFSKYITFEIEKAAYYHTEIVNIPCSSNLTIEAVEYVATEIKDILG